MSLNKKLHKLIENFKNVKVVVIGDIIMDEYIWGDVSRISPEAPVPVVNVKKKTFHAGGSGNASTNMASLGANVFPIGVVGNDSTGIKLKELLKGKNINCDGIIEENDRRTINKTRIIARSQHIVRVDLEDTKPLKQETIEKLLEKIKDLVPKANIVVISDYNKGVINSYLMEELITIIKKGAIVTIADIKPQNVYLIKGITLITPNKIEAAAISGIEITNDENLRSAGWKILDEVRLKGVIITLGENGMALFEEQGDMFKIPAVAMEVYDVTGAGDTVTGVFSVAYASGASMKEAAIISNLAAGVVVSKKGTASATIEEISKMINTQLDKITY